MSLILLENVMMATTEVDFSTLYPNAYFCSKFFQIYS